MAHVEKEIQVDKPVDQVYSQWTQFEEFPKFMENVEQVRQLDDKHLEWKAKVAGTERKWKAEIVEQRPNRVIAWRAIASIASGVRRCAESSIVILRCLSGSHSCDHRMPTRRR